MRVQQLDVSVETKVRSGAWPNMLAASWGLLCQRWAVAAAVAACFRQRVRSSAQARPLCRPVWKPVRAMPMPLWPFAAPAITQLPGSDPGQCVHNPGGVDPIPSGSRVALRGVGRPSGPGQGKAPLRVPVTQGRVPVLAPANAPVRGQLRPLTVCARACPPRNARPQAFYRLTDYRSQIRSYVFDVVRASVPK
jgi:hypothetical protein